MRSLRTRLIIGIIGAMLLLLTVFSLIVYSVIRRALVNQFDQSLASTARILAASVEMDGDEIDLELDVQQMPEFQRPDRPSYYQLWRHDGTVAAKSPSLGKDDILRFEGPFSTPVFRAFQMRNSRPGRAVGFKFSPRADSRDSNRQTAIQQALTLVVARDAGGLHRQLSFLQSLLLVASGVTIALSVLIAAFVVRQGLRPLDSIAAEIAAIKEDDLAVRVATASVPLEIAPIKDRLNELLSRLEDAFKRERRFTADVAHELRTPLAGIRSTIEVALSRGRDTAEYQTVLSECLAIVENMQIMMNNLLMIARLDACQVTFRHEQINLLEQVDSCWGPFSEKAIGREIAFANRVPNDVTVNSDRDNLSMVLSNLLNNAVEYTNDAGQIWVAAQNTDESVEVTVGNTGCRLTNEQAAQVFDCFWRGDSSRKDAGVHSGLGLALVKRIITALNGAVTAQIDQPDTFKINLTLPGPHAATSD